MDFVKQVIAIASQMAPYLLFGFLMAGILSEFLSPKLIEKYLGKKGFFSWLKAAFFGVPMPLCSCSVIPVTVALYKNGAGRGAVASFLASTPQTGIDSILVTGGLLGWPFCIFRVFIAFISGVFCGGAVETFVKQEDVIEPKKEVQEENHTSWSISRALRYAFVQIPQDIGKSLVFGILLSALLGAIIPDDFFATTIGHPFWGMLIMLVVGLPLYVCSTASVPMALVFILKGLSPGAVFVFLIVGPATNGVTIATISQILGKKAMVIYLAVLSGIAILSGLILDQIPSIVDLARKQSESCLHPNNNWQYIALGIIVVLLCNAWRLRNKKECCSAKISEDNNNISSCCSKQSVEQKVEEKEPVKPCCCKK